MAILAAAHDPGGAKMLLPVVRALSGQDLSVYAGELVREFYSEQGVITELLPRDLSEAAALEIWEKHTPSILLTATSWNSNAEERLRGVALASGARSIALVDSWGSYRERFGGRVPARQQIIGVVDQEMASEMTANGFAPEQLRVIGQPHLEVLALGPRPGKSAVKKVLFLSEPRSTVQNEDPQHPLRILVGGLVELFPDSEIQVHFKIHPKENMGRQAELVNASSTKLIHVSFAPPELSLPSDFSQYDLIAGIHSTGLFEAASMGLRVVAFPRGPLGSAFLRMFDHLGIVKDDLPLAINSWPKPLPQDYRNSVDRVLDVIRRG